MQDYCDDFDPYVLGEIKPACVRLTPPDGSDRKGGSGFLISDREIVTCHHVVDSVGVAGRLACRFGETGLTGNATVDPARDNAELDVSVLLLDAPVPGIAPVPLARPDNRFASWWAWGFPVFAEGLGVTLQGRLLDPATRDKDNRPAVALFGDALTGEDAGLGGLSGSPVFSGRAVVAMVFRILSDPKVGSKATHLGMLYALPMASIRRVAFPSGDAAAPAATPAVPGPGYEGLAPRLVALQEQLACAGSAPEILEALGEWRAAGVPAEGASIYAAELLVALGDIDATLDVLEPVLKASPESVRARQLKALSLSLKGEHGEAQALLRALPPSAESGGITGGILKRRYLETGQRNWLVACYNQYRTTYDATRDPYPGVNVAALALWKGSAEESRRVAAEVIEALRGKPNPDHWDLASLAEAHLLSGDIAKARSAYQDACDRAYGRPTPLFRDVATMRKQARIDLEKLGQPRTALDDTFPVPGLACVAGVAGIGERPDPGRMDALADRFRGLVREHDIRVGYSSACSGPEVLFLETMLDAGREATIFLPCPRAACAERYLPADWRQRFSEALDRLPPGRLVIASEAVPGSRDEAAKALVACQTRMRDTARDTGRMLDEPPRLLAVCATAAGDVEPWTAAQAARVWRQRNLGPVQFIDPAGGAAVDG